MLVQKNQFETKKNYFFLLDLTCCYNFWLINLCAVETNDIRLQEYLIQEEIQFRKTV